MKEAREIGPLFLCRHSGLLSLSSGFDAAHRPQMRNCASGNDVLANAKSGTAKILVP